MINRAPIRTPLLERDGSLTPPWQRYFDRLAEDSAPVIVAQPATIAAAEKANSRTLDPANQLTSLVVKVDLHFRRALAVGTWVTFWLSKDNGATWVWGDRRSISGTDPSFEFTQLVPADKQTWKVRVAPGIIGYDTSPDDALVSAGFEVLGIQPCGANRVTDANVSIGYKQNSDGAWFWGGDVTWKNPAAAAEVYFWIAKLYIQHVNAGGEADPAYGTVEVTESNEVAAVVVKTSDRNWPTPKATDLYPIYRYTLKLCNRNNVEVLQTSCWPGGAAYLDVAPEVKENPSSGGLVAPALPASVTIAEKPGSRRLRLSDQTGWFTLQITVVLPAPPVAGEWVSFWPSRDNGVTWDGGALEFPITLQTQTFEVEYFIPESDQTWRGKATTSSPSGFNVPDDAVVSDPCVIPGIGDPSAGEVTGASVTNLRFGYGGDGQSLYGCQVNGTVAATDAYAWFAFWTRQYVSSTGVPDPARPEEIHGNEFRPGTIVEDAGGVDQPMPANQTYRWMRTRWYVRNRLGKDILQTNAFGAGVDHLDVELTEQPGALRVDRGDASRMLGLHVSGGKLQPKTGNGLTVDAGANQLLANVGGVLGFSAGAIQVSLGSGLQNNLGSLYAKVAQGLGFDGSGNIQIPTNGVGQSLLANSQIIDAARLVNYAVSQMKLQNAQIIDAARIVDLAVVTGKIGLLAVGAAQIADAAITSAKINDLSVSKLTAGTATFSGDMTFQNTGGIKMYNGGSVEVNPGTLYAAALYTASPVDRFLILPNSISCQSAGSFVKAGGFRIPTVGADLIGQTVHVIYKAADGVTNAHLYFNGGILTSYA